MRLNRHISLKDKIDTKSNPVPIEINSQLIPYVNTATKKLGNGTKY